MNNKYERELQISTIIDIDRPKSIAASARLFFKANYPKASFKRVENAFILTRRLFDGRYPGYLPCAVAYHDYVHSLSVFAATSRLLDGCELSGQSVGPERAAELLIAALLHDAGYLREKADTTGTGAQYTKIHVDRSAAFALREAESFGLPGVAAARVARIILATDLARPWDSLTFMDEPERTCARLLAAADLLGQMADRAYLEKLLFLYYEFREAGIEGYHNAYDILKKTAGFYELTKARLDGPLGSVSMMAKEHFFVRYAIDRDLYREAVARQMAYLDTIIADDTDNFRKKLKRLDLEAIERQTGIA